MPGLSRNACWSWSLTSLDRALFKRIFEILTSSRNLRWLKSLWLSTAVSSLFGLRTLLASWFIFKSSLLWKSFRCDFTCSTLGFLAVVLLPHFNPIWRILNQRFFIFDHNILDIFGKEPIDTSARFCVIPLQILNAQYHSGFQDSGPLCFTEVLQKITDLATWEQCWLKIFKLRHIGIMRIKFKFEKYLDLLII